MTKTYSDELHFSGVSALQLFQLYADPKLHSEVIGASVKNTNILGPASIYDDYISAVNLLLEPGKLIVQTWRSSDWPDGAADSLLILRFSEKGNTGVLKVCHEGLPESVYQRMVDGWREYYWENWKDWFQL